METCQREGLRATGDEGAVKDLEAELSNRGKPQGLQEKEGRDRGRGGGDITWGDPPNPQEAWIQLKGWYKAAIECASPPARATLERITVERVDLYS